MVNSLHELIKQKSKERGRKLRVSCDWDETMQVHKPKLKWDHQEKNKENYSSFEEYFKVFWENYKGKHKGGYSWSKNNGVVKPQNFYEKSPWLSPSEDLLKCLKDDLIELLVFNTIRNKKTHPHGDDRKPRIYRRTFGKFSQTRFDQYIMDTSIEKRTNIIKKQEIVKRFPEFDIYIDDNPKIIDEVRKNFGSEKIYVLPDYKFNRNIIGDNIYHVKTSISNVLDSDFSIAVLEKRLEYLKKEIKRETEIKNRIIGLSFWWILLPISAVFLIFIFFITNKRNKKPC